MRGLSVIIPSKNADNLRVCLAAVRKYDPSVRIVVVDDSECIAVPRVCHEYETDWESGDRPFGFARNCNIGIRSAPAGASLDALSTDDIILLNDDALLETPGGFTAMHHAARSRPEFGIVSAAVIGPSNSYEHAPRDGAGIRETKGRTIPFVCVLIRREVLDCVGPLEERFAGVYGGEDDDYSFRVRQAGLKLGIFDGCVVNHGKLQSTFRPDGRGLPIGETKKRFKEIHGFEMGTR
jgi:GT2 family glycosyltransferase